MNHNSFYDELVKVGVLAQFARPLRQNSLANLVHRTLRRLMTKRADATISSAPNTNPQAVPEHIRIDPEDPKTWVPSTPTAGGNLVPGKLGVVEAAKKPIDGMKFNRSWETQNA